MAASWFRSLRRNDPDQVRWVGLHLSALAGTPTEFASDVAAKLWPVNGIASAYRPSILIE